MTFQQLKERSNKFVADLDTYIADIVNYNEELEELNRKQLRESKKPDDSPLRPAYRRRYAMWKQFYYPSSYGDGNVNLYLTDYLYKSLEIKAKGSEFFITTDVPYAADLIDKYGPFLGIAPSNIEAAQRITVPLLAAKYKQLVLQ